MLVISPKRDCECTRNINTENIFLKKKKRKKTLPTPSILINENKTQPDLLNYSGDLIKCNQIPNTTMLGIASLT